MRIADDKSDAIELIRDIKTEMAHVRSLLAELEYVIYLNDDRVEISFFERGEDGSAKKSKE